MYNLEGASYSIGNLSIEPQPWRSSTSIASNGTDKRKSARSVRSMKSLKSLRPNASRDSLRGSDGEKVIRKPKHETGSQRSRIFVTDSSAESPLPSPLSDAFTVPKRDSRSSLPWESPAVPKRDSSMIAGKMSKRLYLQADDITGGPLNINHGHNGIIQDYIPRRASSKRHSLVTSSPNPKRKSHLSERSNAHETEGFPVDTQLGLSEQPVSEEPEAPEESLEDGVTRRIRELRDQKLKRDRNSLENSSGFQTAPQTPERNVTPVPSQVAQPLDDSETMAPLSETPSGLIPEVEEGTAPSPAVASRAKRQSLNGTKVTNIKRLQISPEAEDAVRSFSSPQVPQRSNSRLLKRLSQHATPGTAGKHRRTASNPADSSQLEYSDPIDEEVEQYLSAPRLNQKVQRNRRTISFSEVGDPKGSVVFICVGMGLTRFLTAFYDELAMTLKLRLITPDRPGCGGSEAHEDGSNTPLSWPDDVRTICENLNITKFSILAHSAGAIYALATALRMPQHIRCRVHLLAPWIPPSQMSSLSASQEPLPATALPYSQRILRALPATFLRAANSNFLSVNSNSITTSLPRSPRRSKTKSFNKAEKQVLDSPATTTGTDSSPSSPDPRRTSADHSLKENRPPAADSSPAPPPKLPLPTASHKHEYETRLTHSIWRAATTAANPATDLLICLERPSPIGFRYVDITRAVVIHHGSKDTRVPVENVKWLGKMMRRCEVRVLEGEGHGLMASGGVMGRVLEEMAGEWEDWNRVVRGRREEGRFG